MREGWTYKKLMDVCDKGSSNIVISKLENNNGNYPLYGASGLVKGVDFYHQDKPYIGIVKDGAGVGRVNIYPAQSSLVGTMQYIFPKESCSLEYIKYFLIKLDLSKHVSGATIPHIYFKDYGKELIPLPPKSQQEAIVSELDEINSLLALKREQLQTYDKLAQSLFYEMFGDPVVNEKGWEFSSLSNICSTITDGSHNPPKGGEISPYLMLSSKNIKDGNLSFEDPRFLTENEYVVENKRTNVQKGDILLTIVGTIGRCCIFDSSEYIVFQRSVAILKPKNTINSHYLMHHIIALRGYLESEAKGVAQKGIYLNQLGKILVLLPPLTLQQQFASRIEQIEEQKQQVQAAIERLETLLASRMQYWFE